MRPTSIPCLFLLAAVSSAQQPPGNALEKQVADLEERLVGLGVDGGHEPLRRRRPQEVLAEPAWHAARTSRGRG